MGLKKILFKTPIIDRRLNQNLKIYFEISGRPGSERKAYLKDAREYILEMRFFTKDELQEELYKKAEKFLKKYFKDKEGKERILPGNFLAELLS